MRLPKQRLIVGGVDISERFNFVMTDNYTLSPPEVVTYKVDVIGRVEGPLDLTEATLGQVPYGRRKQEFVFASLNPSTFEVDKTLLSNFLHGKKFDYVINFDPEYTYTGRFSVTDYKADYSAGYVKIVIDAEPFKLKEHRTYVMSAAGGKEFVFESGRMPVKPTIEVKTPSLIIAENGTQIEVSIGTWQLAKVVFHEGTNRLFIRSTSVSAARWADFNQDYVNDDDASDIPKFPMTYGQMENYTWNDLAKMGWEEAEDDPLVDPTVYVSYDWKDL